MKNPDQTPSNSMDTNDNKELESMSSMPSATGNSSQASLSPAVQKHIGNLLKVSYQNLLTEPVPDRFASLLEQLEQAEKKGS